MYLAIVVLVTITLCYQLCVQFSVSPLIIRDFGMTFTSFVYISVVGNAIGAFASLAAGLADHWGRAKSRHVRPAGDRCAGSRWAAQRAEQGDLPGPVRGG